MGQTAIEWTATYNDDGTITPGYTLNFWWGCVKVSPGCEHCYAETFSKRVGKNIWGPAQTTERWRTSGPWKDCLKWDRQAKKAGERRRVFCQSMSDFFEDHPQVEPWRQEAMGILERFEWLDVQLLTKRPENISKMVPARWLENWPQHIWIGTSVENQEQADKRIPHLLCIPAAVRFLSVEPLLGPVDIQWCDWCGRFGEHDCEGGYDWALTEEQDQVGIDWVIVGGESGPNARPMHPDWALSIRDQCQAAGVPFFFKQWGEYIPYNQRLFEGIEDIHSNRDYLDIDGKCQDQETLVTVLKVGKKSAGRLLDGREWNEFPQTIQVAE